jgi:type VI protein secretion system component VasK
MVYASPMSIRSALKPVFRPFASVLIADRDWAKFADVGYAGVIAGAAGALLAGGALVHGRWQVALLVVGSVLVVVALVLATLAMWKKTSKRKTADQHQAEGQGQAPSDDWDGDLDESERTNRELEKALKSKQQRSSDSNKP